MLAIPSGFPTIHQCDGETSERAWSRLRDSSNLPHTVSWTMERTLTLGQSTKDNSEKAMGNESLGNGASLGHLDSCTVH